MKLSLVFHAARIWEEILPKDIFSGIIIAAVSIPISMGYAQISGIPAVYGLYGSVLPILLFALFSTSRQFIFGVDAAPAAIVGGALSTLGIAAESEAAMDYVPAIALFAGLWLFIFFLLHAGSDRGLYLHTCYGRFYQRYRSYHHPEMQIPKLIGKSCRIRRAPGTGRAYLCCCQKYQLAFPLHGAWCSGADPHI